MFCEVLFGYKLQPILVTLTMLRVELGRIRVQLPASDGGTNFSLSCFNSMDPPPRGAAAQRGPWPPHP